jgi:hypothetical protein
MLTRGTLEVFMTTWNTLFKIMLTCGPKLVYDDTDMAKMIKCGTLENFMMTWNILFSKKFLHVGPY